MALSNRSEFSVIYEGPALEDGSMAVRDLAPSLLALSEIVQEINLAANPAGPPVNLEIRAFNRGSFAVQLHLVEGFLRHMVNLLNTGEVIALNNLRDLLGLGGLFGFFKWVYNKTIASREEHDDGTTTLVATDGDIARFPSVVVQLYQSSTIRVNVSNFVEPLHRDGIEQVVYQAPGREPFAIGKQDLDAFDLPPLEGTPILDQTSEMALMIRNVAFGEGNKWRLSNGPHTFYVTMADNEFLERVASGDEEFRNGDILICLLRMLQWQTDTGLRAEYVVLRVLDHRRASGPRNVPLPFS